LALQGVDECRPRQAELLPLEYYHVVFTLPEPIGNIAYR
jgi:hypothetical protein